MTKNSRALVPCGEVKTIITDRYGREVVNCLLLHIRWTVNDALAEADEKFVLPLLKEDINEGDTLISTFVPFGLIDWDKCKTTVEAQIKEKCYLALFEDKNINNLLESKTRIKYKYLIYILRYIFVKDVKHSLGLNKILQPRVFATSLNRGIHSPMITSPIGIRIELHCNCREKGYVRIWFKIKYFKLKKKFPGFRVRGLEYGENDFDEKNFKKRIICNFRTLCKYFLLHKVHFVLDVILKLFNCLKRKCPV